MLSFFLYSNPKMNATSTDQILQKIDRLEEYTVQMEAEDTTVSKVGVDWHLAHSLKTINGICDALAKSSPEDYSWSANVARTMSLTFNFIPRGRAQSPRSVIPDEVITLADLQQMIQQARLNVQKAIMLPEQANFEHPVFGVITRGEALRFLEVHTQHHLKIIEDIIGHAPIALAFNKS